MKIKSLVIVAVLAVAILCSAGFVSAQTAPTSDQLTQQLIQVLTQLITQLQQEIAAILAQSPTPTPPPTSLQNPLLPAGCTSTSGYSSVTGLPCTTIPTTCSSNSDCVSGSTCNNGSCTAVINSLAQPSITVISPNGGETLTIGQTYNIVWNKGSYPDVNVVIGIQDPKFYQGYVGITQAIPNTGSYQWTVALSQILTGSNFQPDNNYRISIGSAYNLNNYYESDTSDAPFSIVAPNSSDLNGDGVVNGADLIIFQGCLNQPMTDACKVADLNGDGQVDFSDLWIFKQAYPATPVPSITITSPNGGEQWAQGSTHNITWTSSGIPSGDLVSAFITNDSTGLNTTIFSNVPASQGSYSWAIPSSMVFGSQYKIQVAPIISNGAGQGGVSANYFSIYRPTGDLNGDGVSNNADLAIFSACLNQPMTDACKVADLNGSGNVDNADLWIFRQFYTAPATTNSCNTTDVNNDGKVNSADNDSYVSLYQSNNLRADICGAGFASTSWYADGKVTPEDYDCFLDLYQRCQTN